VRSARHAILVGLLVLVLPLLGACGGEPDGTFHGKVLDNPFEVPATPLTDTDGKPFSLADDTDKRLTLVFFGYTHCPDICHTVMGALASAMTRLDEADREQVDVVFVTTDPARDTPQVLRDYLDHLDPSFIGLTGPLGTIVEVGNALAVGVDTTDPGGHTTATMAVDSDDTSPVYWGEQTSAAQFASDIHSLLEEQ
jgi:protein SCO1/2